MSTTAKWYRWHLDAGSGPGCGSVRCRHSDRSQGQLAFAAALLFLSSSPFLDSSLKDGPVVVS